MASQTAEKRLYRSRDAYVAGVCAGIADYLDFDPIVIRILAILLAGITLGLAIVVYLMLWAKIPRQTESSALYDVRPESAESTAYGCVDCDAGFANADNSESVPILARVAVATGLMLLFLAVAVNLSPRMPGTQWWQFWPLIVLCVGLCLIIIPVKTTFEAAWHSAGIVITSVAAMLLPMSLNVVSWNTIPCGIATLWPLLILAFGLFGIGAYRKIDALMVAAAFCIVIFCLLSITLCVLPGELEALLLHMPSGHSITIVVPH